MPLYHGCPNLADYDPRESFAEIDLDAPDAADEVIRRSREPIGPATLDAIAEARQLALDRDSAWGTLAQLFASGRLDARGEGPATEAEARAGF